MKKLISIIALAAVLFCGLSCSKDNSVPEIELKSCSMYSHILVIRSVLRTLRSMLKAAIPSASQ